MYTAKEAPIETSAARDWRLLAAAVFTAIGAVSALLLRIFWNTGGLHNSPEAMRAMIRAWLIPPLVIAGAGVASSIVAFAILASQSK